ncbi:hypothetical protein N657DRAFT_405836 [Parathielavia appendiculata]|uniref:Uncharacterized protein n=1 Tax=Parathielavia appendiculata TaxID=2587402 RepID=A0AAN6TPD3_9PEZI|nr:hypothetical protein N657DRAFT_405836 [Parathielavia appendiculata]
MAETYWDPANLLQITALDDSLEVQCLGRGARGRPNSRCRLTLSASDAAPTLFKIKKMAAMPPSKVTQQDLEALAKLCLCKEHHAPQWYQVAQRWKYVVANAVKQHDRLAAPKENGFSERVRIETLLLERRKFCEALGLKHDIGDLSVKLSAHLTILDKAKTKAETAQSAAEKKLQEVKEELDQANEKLAQLKDDLDRAIAVGSQPAGGYRFAVRQVDEIRNVEAPRLAEMLKLVEVAKNERNELKSRINALESDLSSVGCCLDEERAKSRAMEDSNIELEEQVATVTQRLAASEALLEEEREKTRELEEARGDLARRLSKANTEVKRAWSLVEEEKSKTAASKSVQGEYHRRLNDAYIERDRLLTEERAKARETLRQTTLHLEQRLREVNTEAQKMLHKERTRAKVLSDIRTELKNRLSEVRAAAAAEAQKAQREIETLDKKHQAAVNQVHRLQSDLNKAKARQSTIERDLSESRNTAKTVQSLNDKLTATNTTLNHQLTAVQQQVTALKAKRWRPRIRALFHSLEPTPRPSNSSPSSTLPTKK